MIRFVLSWGLLCGVVAAPCAAWGELAATPSSAPASRPAVAAAPVAQKERDQPDWTERVVVAAMVDAYYAINYNFPEPTNTDGAASALRAFDQASGFALSWVGLDLRYPAAPVGATLNLRFGPSAARYAGDRETDLGLHYLRQAYVSWQVTKRLGFDFGKFDTIYGVEASDAHARVSYSLGTVPFFVQPNYHTGLRASYAPTAALKITALVVNGLVSGSVDNNVGKSFGLQLAYEAGMLTATLGYFIGPERDDDNQHLLHFFDATLALEPWAGTKVAINGDFGYEDADGGVRWWGAALLAQQRFLQRFRVALRGELVGDPDGVLAGVADMTWVTATLTFDVIIARALLIRLENRLDLTTEPLFLRRQNATLEKTQVTTVLGVVLTTGEL